MGAIRTKLHNAVVLLLLVLAAGVLGGCAGGKSSGFVAPPFEENAVSGTPETVEEALNYRRLEIKEGFVVALCGSLTADADGAVEVYFTADEENTVWVRLVVLTEDGQELGSTGILQAGEYVQCVHLDTVPDTSQTIELKILSYEPETYYSCGSASALVQLNLASS